MSQFYDDYIDKCKLSSIEFILAILNDPLLIYEDALQEKLKDLSMQMKGWVEGKSKTDKRPRSKEFKILLIFYLCPYLIRAKEFSWLWYELCAIIRDSHFSSKAFNKFWVTLDLIKREFRTTKAFRPELPSKICFEIIRETANEQRQARINFLKELYKEYKEINSKYFVRLSQQSKINDIIIDSELNRLSCAVEKYSEEKKVKQKEAIEKYSEEIWGEIYRDPDSNKQFWSWAEKQFLEKPKKKIEMSAMQKVAEKNGISLRRVQRHLNYLNALWQKSSPQ